MGKDSQGLDSQQLGITEHGNPKTRPAAENSYVHTSLELKTRPRLMQTVSTKYEIAHLTHRTGKKKNFNFYSFYFGGG